MMFPHACYLICGTPRCGSSRLAEALGNTKVAGHPAEYFWRGDEPMWAQRWGLADYTYAQYLAAALQHGTTQNGVFGAKMMWWNYLDVFLEKVRAIPGCDMPDPSAVLARVFPDLHYIWLSRRHKVRQGVSHWKAIQTGVWGTTADAERPRGGDAIYDFNAIHQLVEAATTHDAAWQTYFSDYGIQPFTLVYEDFVENYEPTIAHILHFLGITKVPDIGLVNRKLRKQADATTESWVQRYLETMSH